MSGNFRIQRIPLELNVSAFACKYILLLTVGEHFNTFSYSYFPTLDICALYS